MRKLPNHYIKFDRLSKTKSVIKYYRNNLSLDMFELDEEQNYTYTEEIKYNGCNVDICIVLKTNNIPSLWHEEKCFKIKGSPECFSLFSRISISAFPGTIKGETDYLKCYVRFYGDIKNLKKSWEIKRRQEKNKRKGNVKIISSNSTAPHPAVPSYIQRNAFHPYQGGRVSPK